MVVPFWISEKHYDAFSKIPKQKHNCTENMVYHMDSKSKLAASMVF
jgi:hypothetical protein